MTKHQEAPALKTTAEEREAWRNGRRRGGDMTEEIKKVAEGIVAGLMPWYQVKWDPDQSSPEQFVVDELTKLLPRWVPVGERLPDAPNGMFLVVYLFQGKHPCQMVAAWYGECFHSVEPHVLNVTHWKPLEPLPLKPEES